MFRLSAYLNNPPLAAKSKWKSACLSLRPERFRNSLLSFAAVVLLRARPTIIRTRRANNVPAGLLLKIDIGKRLAGRVLHDEACGQFLDRQGRREAAGGPPRDFFLCYHPDRIWARRKVRKK